MATAEEQIRRIEAQANVVATLRDVLRRAKRGEIVAVVVAAEHTDGSEGTVYSTMPSSQRHRLAGLLHVALHRLVG